MSFSKTITPYRGLLQDVSDCMNDPKGILERTDLDWAGVKVPLYAEHWNYRSHPIQDQYVQTPYDNRYAIARPNNDGTVTFIDGGKPVGPHFKLLDNRTIIKDMCEFANKTNLNIDYAGAIDNGRLVVASAVSENLKDIAGGDVDLKKGDVVQTGVIMVGSYESGLSSSWMYQVMRLVCLNGMCKKMSKSAYRVRHHGQRYESSGVMNIFRDLETHSTEVLEKLATFAKTKANAAVQHAMLLQLTQEDLFSAVLEETKQRIGTSFSWSPKMFLEALTESQDVVEILLENVRDKGSRTMKNLIEINNSQPGLQYVEGTIAQPLHAITHWVDHHRGNRVDSGVESSLFGVGALLKENAMQLAGQYQNVLQ